MFRSPGSSSRLLCRVRTHNVPVVIQRSNRSWLNPFLSILIGVPKKRILDICQVPKPHERPLLLARRSKSLLHQISCLHPVAPAQVAREEQQDDDLDAVSDHDGDDAGGVARRFAGLEGKRPDDIAYAIGDEEDGIDSCAFGGAGNVGGDQRHAHGEGSGVESCQLGWGVSKLKMKVKGRGSSRTQ